MRGKILQGIISENLYRVETIAILFASSIVLRQILIAAGQTWIQTYAHTLSLALLPIITYTISSVISGNIALSLGMVGALSIVRFRNPVKSPFELVVFFLYITMGIAASVSLSWMVALLATVSIILIGFHLTDQFVKKSNGQGLFQASFSEGNELPTVEIESGESLPHLLEDDRLLSYSVEDQKYHYVIASRDRQSLLELIKDYQLRDSVNFVRFASY